MNESLVICLLGIAFLTMVAALPTSEAPQRSVEIKEEKFEMESSGKDFLANIEPERGDRFRRVTCDLLGVDTAIGSLNDSACAAHCIALRKGYKGGRCRDGVCHCRK